MLLMSFGVLVKAMYDVSPVQFAAGRSTGEEMTCMSTFGPIVPLQHADLPSSAVIFLRFDVALGLLSLSFSFPLMCSTNHVSGRRPRSDVSVSFRHLLIGFHGSQLPTSSENIEPVSRYPPTSGETAKHVGARLR